MHAPSPPPPSAPAAATLPLSPSSSSSFNSSAPHSPLPHRPTVRVLSSQEDLASRPPSALSARSSPTPGPERALSSRPAAQGPQTSTLNGRAVSPGTLFLASTRRVGSNGAEQSGGGLSTADAAGRIARESGSRDELERPSSTTSPTPQAQDVTPSAARPSGRTTPTPNALSPRLRPHGPIITRVSSPMDPSFAARTTPDTGSHDGSSSAAFPPSPTVAARPLSPPSTVARRSSSDLLAAYASPEGSHLAPLSPGDVVADSAAGATFVRERHATAGRASEDSFASGSMQDTQPPRPTVPASRPAQQAQSHNAEPPFSSLHVAPPRPSTSPSPPASTAAPAVVPSRLHHVHPTSSTSPRAPRPQRKHVLHPGRNRFLLSGRLLTSGDNPLPLVGSLGVAFALPALWWAFNGRFLWGEWSGAGKAGVFVFAYLVLVMWSSMVRLSSFHCRLESPQVSLSADSRDDLPSAQLRTAFSDPGILPRDLDPVPPRKWVPRSRAGEDSTASDGEWLVEAKWIRVRDGGVVASKCASRGSIVLRCAALQLPEQGGRRALLVQVNRLTPVAAPQGARRVTRTARRGRATAACATTASSGQITTCVLRCASSSVSALTSAASCAVRLLEQRGS